MAISQNFPDVRPSLNLNFARSKTLDPRITFERASIGTYVDENGLIKTAAADEARFDHNPETGESLGLLIEESRTNLLPQSQQYTSTYWNDLSTLPTGWTTTAGPAPDGSNTVTTWNSGNQIYETNVSYSVGPQYTASVFVKDMTGGGGSVRLGPDHTSDYVGGDPRVTFQPSTQSFITVGSGVQGYGYYEYPNGWYRVWFKYTLSQSDNIFNIVQLGAYNIGIWGAQIEAGSFPTSYIPTSGSTVTRQVERANITGTNFSSWYNQDEGTIFLESNTSRNSNLILSSKYIWGLNDGSSANYIGYSSNRYQTSGGQVSLSHNIESTFKSASSYKKDDFAVSDKGSPVLTDTSAILPTGINRLTIGDLEPVGNRRINTTISKLLYYPERLTNTQLQNLTK